MIIFKDNVKYEYIYMKYTENIYTSSIIIYPPKNINSSMYATPSNVVKMREASFTFSDLSARVSVAINIRALYIQSRMYA